MSSLLGRQLQRLEHIATELSGLYADLARCKIAEAEQKANIYLSLPENMSHGERQARASHQTVSQDSEIREILARIDGLREERDLLKLLVTFDMDAAS